MARAQKAEIRTDEDAAAAGKPAEQVERAAKEQAAAIKNATAVQQAEKHAAATKKVGAG